MIDRFVRSLKAHLVQRRHAWTYSNDWIGNTESGYTSVDGIVDEENLLNEIDEFAKKFKREKKI